MSEELKIFIIFLIGVISAYLGSFTSGGASAISIALMVMIGIPPQMAGITFKLGKVGDRIGGIFLLGKHGYIPKKHILGGGIAVVTGGFIGSYFISQIPEAIMYLISGVSMLFLVGASFIGKYGEQVQSIPLSETRRYLGYVSYFFLAVFGNLFPAASGVWYYFINTIILRLSSIESKGIASIVSMFWFIGTLAGILVAGVYHIGWGMALGLGMVLGGYLGTKHIIKLGDKKMQKILIISITIFAFYFLSLAYNSWSN